VLWVPRPAMAPPGPIAVQNQESCTMSRTFKGTPTRVRIARNRRAVEVHIGCPPADRPRMRRVRVERWSEPRWHTVNKNPLSWPDRTGGIHWRYGPVFEVSWQWEPYWVDVCDIDVAGGHNWLNRRCRRETNDYLGVYGSRRRHGLKPPTGRAASRLALRFSVSRRDGIGVVSGGTELMRIGGPDRIVAAQDTDGDLVELGQARHSL